MVNILIKWKKINTLLLVSSLMIPIVSEQVYAEQKIEDDNTLINNQKNSESLKSLHSSNDNSHIYKINEKTQEVVDKGEHQFKEQKYFLTSEMKINDLVYLKIESDDTEIGWIETSSLEKMNFDIVDTRTESELYKINKEQIETEESSDLDKQSTNDKPEEKLNEATKELSHEKESARSEKNRENNSEQLSESEILEEISESDKDDSIVKKKSNKENKSDRSKKEEDSNNKKIESSTMSISSRSNDLEVTSTKNVSYAAEITQPWSINTQPWGTSGADFIASAEKYIGETMIVSQEKVTSRSTYALISYKGKQIGWIDITGIRKHKILKTENVNYTVEVTKPWSINNKPWGTEGYKSAVGTSVVGNEYVVKKEATTPRSTYVLLTKNNENIGWIDSTGIEKRLPVLSEKRVEYAAKVVKSWSVNTRPWGTTGAKKVIADGALVGKSVKINKEIETPRSTYALISVGGKQIGWVDKTALDILKISEYTNVNYSVIITKPWSINSLPWGIKGYKTIKSNAEIDTGYTVVKEAKTSRSKYVLLEKNGKTVGWIDKTGVKKVAEITSSKKIRYNAIISQPWSINTNPYGTLGFKKIMSAKNIIGESVTVSEEKITKSGTYAYISLKDKELGWINITGLSKIEISSSSKDYATVVEERKKSVLYDASIKANKISDSWDYAVKGYLKYPNDKRFKEAIEKSATRLLSYAENLNSKTALVYYNQMLEGPWLPDYIFKKVTIAKEKALQKLDSDYAYQEIIKEKNKFIAWELASQALVDHPNEQRIADYITDQAKVWLKEAISLHKDSQYDNAIQRYNLLINGPTNLYTGEKTAEKYKILAINKLVPNHASYQRTFYQKTLEDALNQQMRRAPQVQSGGNWVNASRSQVNEYLNPDNFMDGINKDSDIPVIKGKVNVSTLNVRSGSSTKFGVIDQIYKNQEVSIIQESNGWLNISYLSSDKMKSGWVYEPYIDLMIKEDSSHEFAEAYNPIARITASVLNVRTGPSTKHGLLTQVKEGQRYKLVKEDQNWYQLDLGNGQLGWVFGNYISVSNNMNKDLLQFLKLSGSSGISTEKINDEIGNSGVLSNMGYAFIEASKKYNINEIYLLSHAKLETGNGSSSLATGIRVTHVDGKPVTPKVVYNMFGIGAYDSSPNIWR